MTSVPINNEPEDDPLNDVLILLPTLFNPNPLDTLFPTLEAPLLIVLPIEDTPLFTLLPSDDTLLDLVKLII